MVGCCDEPIVLVARKLQTLTDLGLSYIKLGQNAATLSGGEAQRVKLAKDLSERATGHTLLPGPSASAPAGKAQAHRLKQHGVPDDVTEPVRSVPADRKTAFE